MERNNKIPITRINRFFDHQDFQLDIDIAKELIEDDMNMKVVLYRIDRTKSNFDIYGESSPREVRYQSPVELTVIPLLDKAENKTYAPNGSMRYQEHGMLTFNVLTDHLNEIDVDISYGDIIGYSYTETELKYFEVMDDGKINADNKHTYYGYKPYYRTIKCVVVDPNQFNGH